MLYDWLVFCHGHLTERMFSGKRRRCRDRLALAIVRLGLDICLMRQAKEPITVKDVGDMLQGVWR